MATVDAAVVVRAEHASSGGRFIRLQHLGVEDDTNRVEEDDSVMIWSLHGKESSIKRTCLLLM